MTDKGIHLGTFGFKNPRWNDTTTDCDDCKARIRADIIEELKQKISSCAYNKNIQMISMELLWNCLEQLKEKKQ